MSYSPPWSTHTIPPRGSVISLEHSFKQILAAEYALVDRQRRNILAGELDRLSRSQMLGALATQDFPDPESSESESEDEFTPPVSRYSTEYREYVLRPRIRVPLADITPRPDVFQASDLLALGFREVDWNMPRVFADLENRIGGVFIGPPVEQAEWEKTIVGANRLMRIASAHLDRAMLLNDSIRSGITYDHSLKRPQSIDRTHNLNNMVVLAALRYSKPIQDITSFQNAMLHAVAPRVWNEDRQVIDAVLENDCSLHLPMQLVDVGPNQPTAFSEIQYQFSVPDSQPRRELDDEPGSFRAVTALGNYDSEEGRLILWRERAIVKFPPGSTFIFPGALVRYSFTAVEKPGWQMLISQSCAVGLRGFVANGFEDRYSGQRRFASKAEAKAARNEKAEQAVSLYSTVAEFDAAASRYAY
ncbi:hypothetical protein C8R47DRAFT_1084496 [Mycena vitilis]|nr:hypothetical protein C8R47DRAFT_1084496 [Mycena vitilis]